MQEDPLQVLTHPLRQEGVRVVYPLLQATLQLRILLEGYSGYGDYQQPQRKDGNQDVVGYGGRGEEDMVVVPAAVQAFPEVGGEDAEAAGEDPGERPQDPARQRTAAFDSQPIPP